MTLKYSFSMKSLCREKDYNIQWNISHTHYSPPSYIVLLYFVNFVCCCSWSDWSDSTRNSRRSSSRPNCKLRPSPPSTATSSTRRRWVATAKWSTTRMLSRDMTLASSSDGHPAAARCRAATERWTRTHFTATIPHFRRCDLTLHTSTLVSHNCNCCYVFLSVQIRATTSMLSRRTVSPRNTSRQKQPPTTLHRTLHIR